MKHLMKNPCTDIHIPDQSYLSSFLTEINYTEEVILLKLHFVMKRKRFRLLFHQTSQDDKVPAYEQCIFSYVT